MKHPLLIMSGLSVMNHCLITIRRAAEGDAVANNDRVLHIQLLSAESAAVGDVYDQNIS